MGQSMHAVRRYCILSCHLLFCYFVIQPKTWGIQDNCPTTPVSISSNSFGTRQALALANMWKACRLYARKVDPGLLCCSVNITSNRRLQASLAVAGRRSQHYLMPSMRTTEPETRSIPLYTWWQHESDFDRLITLLRRRPKSGLCVNKKMHFSEFHPPAVSVELFKRHEENQLIIN